MDKKTRILQVNLGNQHSDYVAKLQAIGRKLEALGYNMRDPKKPDNISNAAVIRYLINSQDIS